MKYTELQKHVVEYLPLVILRLSADINHAVPLKDVTLAFLQEGFGSREDFVARVLWEIETSTSDSALELLKRAVKEKSEESATTSDSKISVTEVKIPSYFTVEFDGPDSKIFSLTTEGIIKAEELEEAIYGENFSNFPKETPLAEASSLVTAGTAAEYTNEAVTLNRDDLAYKAAIEKLDEVILELGKPNDPDKQQALAYLKAAKSLLEAPELTQEDIKTLKRWFSWPVLANASERVVALVANLKELLGGWFS